MKPTHNHTHSHARWEQKEKYWQYVQANGKNAKWNEDETWPQPHLARVSPCCYEKTCVTLLENASWWNKKLSEQIICIRYNNNEKKKLLINEKKFENILFKATNY